MNKAFVMPDTQLVKDARVVAEAMLSPAVLNHSMRTYLLARAWASHHYINYDEEGLLVAALFHDLGLAEKYRGETLPYPAIAAREIERFLVERDIPRERIVALTDAIHFHMQMWPRWDKGPIAALLHIGVWMDVAMLRRWTMREEVREIERAFPRLGLEVELPRLLVQSMWTSRSVRGLFFPRVAMEKRNVIETSGDRKLAG